MNKENKKVKAHLKRRLRKNKKYIEFGKIIQTMHSEGISFRASRNKVRNNGRFFQCEMRYSNCESRGYCNGDC